MSDWPPRPRAPRTSPRPAARPQVRLPGRRGVVGLLIAAGVLILILILLKALSFYVDWLWFGEVGKRVVFWTSLWSRIVVGVIFAALFFVIVWPNVELARRLAPRLRPVATEGDVFEYARSTVYRVTGVVGAVVVGVLAVIVGIVTSGSWLTFQRALHGASFGQKDPIFHHDLGFYVFDAPAWHYLQSFVFAAVLVALALAALVHLTLGGLNLGDVGGISVEEGRARFRRPQLGFRLPGPAVAHLSALLAALFVVVGVGQLFKAWNLLIGGGGVVFGATYTDVHANLPAARMLMGLAFLLAAVLVWNVWRRHQWWPLSIAAWIVGFIIVQAIFPAVMQSLIVNPNQLSKERTYIQYNLDATRAAYGLTTISQTPLVLDKAIDAAQLKNNEITLRNIRLWDPDTLVTSYRQLQELRPYYSFTDADVDRYVVGGVLRQTMLSARELNIAGLPANAQTWVNQHITFTHGYGVALSAVNQVTTDGSPDFLVKNIPPQSASGLEITQPRIYYGEIGTDYTLVKTNQKEFDYPGGTGDVYSAYHGTGGIGVGGIGRRLAFCWRFRTIKFFTTSAITAQSRIIIYNNIKARLAKAAPFLSQDKDPYMVIAGGRLYWIIDCYTTTDRYAYSQPQGALNYIRNSVKAVIDAYDGTLTLYDFDPQDPVLKTYGAIFPGILTPADRMPADLRKHIRYPEGYFNVQARMFDTYHVTDPEVLYNKGDQWQVPDSVALSGPGEMAAYYVIMRLPTEQSEEFLLMLPFVPNGRKNMVAWLGARSDPPNYGKAVTIVFPKGSNIYGPSQVEAAINQDPKVSAQLTLWNQSGSSALMGNLLVVPIEKSLLYVQPLYLQAEATKLPQLKQVIVFYQSSAGASGESSQQVAMQPTLGEALTEVFGSAPPVGPTPSPSPSPSPSGSPGTVSAQVRALIEKANTQFEQAQTALKAGDFAAYGKYIAELQATLKQLQQLQ